jgi:hypothetical protein
MALPAPSAGPVPFSGVFLLLFRHCLIDIPVAYGLRRLPEILSFAIFISDITGI